MRAQGHDVHQQLAGVDVDDHALFAGLLEEPEVVGAAVLASIDELEQVLRVAVELTDEELREQGLLKHTVQVGGHETLDAFEQVAALFQHPPDAGELPLRAAFEHPFEQALLVAEVIVEQRLVDPRLIGHLLHARTGHALADEDAAGGGKDALLGAGFLLNSSHQTARLTNWLNRAVNLR